MVGLNRYALWVIAVLSTSGVASRVMASEVSKETCVESHSRGQDAREQGKLSLARKLFLTCAQPDCPVLVQNDCARFADDLERQRAWISFAARDSNGRDLPDTEVYVDDVLVVKRLDDGKPHEVDPGKHAIRFVHGGQKQTASVVVGSGEKGRTVAGTFDPSAAASGNVPSGGAPVTAHAFGARVLFGASTALVLGGGLLAVVELFRVPANCSISSHECAAEPGDRALQEASTAVRWMNAGWVVSGVGAAGLAAGVVWYVRSAKPDRQATTIAPFATLSAAGLMVRGHL